jgi:hypothetical protein
MTSGCSLRRNYSVPRKDDDTAERVPDSFIADIAVTSFRATGTRKISEPIVLIVAR